jgi:hypothetical protein
VGPVTSIVDATFASAGPLPEKASIPADPVLVRFTVTAVPGWVVIVADPPEAKMPLEKLPPAKLIEPLL